MTHIADTPISVFKSAQSVDPVTVRLGAFLDSKRHREQILRLRAIQDKAARDEQKKRLPAATISGVFARRAASAVTAYNGLVCLDFDAKENPGKSPAEMRGVLREFDEVAYAGLSVSGQGVFAVIATNNDDPAQHAAVVDLLGQVLEQYDLYYDRACKDVCRLRFVSFDAEAYWNPQPRLFDAKAMLTAHAATRDTVRRPRDRYIPHSPGSTDSTTEKKVRKYVEAIEAGHLDITDHYEDWMRLGMALAREFGPGGEIYFRRISALSPKFDAAQCERKYTEFIRNTSRIGIGSFFEICNRHNVRL